MPCDLVYGADGRLVAAFCSRVGSTETPCKCGRRSAYVCDHPLTGPKSGQTCDRPLCVSCAVETAPDHHLCPAHAKMVARG